VHVKSIRKNILGTLGLLSITVFLLQALPANAILISFSDTFNPDPDVLISFGGNSSFSFRHNVVTDQDGGESLWSGQYGFDPLTDTISVASLVLRFRDDSADTAAESVSFSVDLQAFGSQTITSGGVTFVSSITGGWGNILDDGIVNIDLANAGVTSGQQDNRSDFLFMDSTLSVRVNRGEEASVQVPVPPTLALFCLGLTGLFWVRVRPG